MSNFLFYLGSFALVLGVLIVVHELGHYIVALLCNVKVLRFSVGFGRPLLLRRWGKDGTEWALGLFPLGGYVKMLDEREGVVPQAELHRAFNRQSVGRRAAIVVAGPVANLLLAVCLYWGLFCFGMEELKPLVGTPPVATAAAEAGFVNGEMVLRVGSEPVRTWQEFRWELLRQGVDRQGAEPLVVEVINPQREIALRRLSISSLAEGYYEGDALARLGIVFFRPHIAPILGQIIPGSVADRAGLKSGDRIIAIDGVPLDSWSEVVQRIRAAPAQALTLEYERGDVHRSVRVVPDTENSQGRAIGRIGVAVQGGGAARDDVMVTVRYGVLTALGKALTETWDKAAFSLVMMAKMLTGEVSWHNLSGPVTIADYAGQSAKLGGDYYLKFLALVSISLGVLNLLPIPVLDGGHLMYYVIEFIKRGPVSERVMEIGQQLGLALLLILMAFAFYNDINRLISG